MIDQGWASGLAGTAKSSTAEAPIGAIIQAAPTEAPSVRRLIRPVRMRPNSAPAQLRMRSKRSTVPGGGTKLRSQFAILSCMIVGDYEMGGGYISPVILFFVRRFPR